MSLRDTIEGARSEVSLPTAAKNEAEAAPAKKSGGARKSSANAKPAREKAASVRTISKDSKKAATLRSQLPGAKKTKEQKEAERAERRKRREEEDYRNQAFTLLLNQNPDYKKSDRLWWILLGIGFVATLVSLIVTFLAPPNGDYTSVSGIVSIGSLIVAYVFIITGFVFDWIKRRPIRKETEKKLAGLSNKKIAEMFAKERKAEMERNAAKAEKKANK